ncbi:hypothetical protein PSN45_005339 [Yamadazyma tenuis]|uniref:uncharacterized protein n=1 Tax=Candida tenuis TaxID=2315449 RepID=UPI00279A3AFE|nr:hypothetical protein PSN45_005339 [Yamadazyma tenuis]
MKIQNILPLVAITHFVRAATDVVGGCSPTEVTEGLFAEYVSLTYEEYGTGNDEAATTALTAIDQATAEYSWGGVTEQNFAFAGAGGSRSPLDKVLYGKTVNINYFGLRLSGYFYAASTGDYTFEISVADDAGSLTIGAGAAMDCCGSGPVTGNLDEYTYWNSNTGTNVPISKTVSLVAGAYYPVKVVYYQAYHGSTLTMSVTYPDGVEHTDDIDWYSSTDNSTTCAIPTTTIPYFGSQTTTLTSDNSNGSPEVYVEVPESTTTITSPWTGSKTTTTTIYPSNPSYPVSVEVMVPESTTTTTKPWTGSGNFTTTIYPSNPSDPVTVEVETPASTATVTTSGSVATTFTVTPSNPNEPLTVVIETPGPTSSTITVTTLWTGSFTTTYTSTGSVSEYIVIVETPELESSIPTTTAPYGNSTVYEEEVITIVKPCTCKEPSTTTETGSNGSKTVVCNVPESLVTTLLITEPCTNAAGESTVTRYTTYIMAATETTAHTGYQTTTSAANGSTDVPQVVSTFEGKGSKITFTFLGVLSTDSFASTYTTIGTDGEPTVVCNIPHSLVSTVVVTKQCNDVAGDVTANPIETAAPTGAEGSGAVGASAGNGSDTSPQDVSTYEAMGSKNTYTFFAVLSVILWISF